MSTQQAESGAEATVAAPDAAERMSPFTRIVTFAVLLAILAVVALKWWHRPLSEVVGWAITTTVLGTLGVLAARYPRANRAVEKAYSVLMTWGFWYLAAFGPILAARWLIDSATWRLALWAQVPAFVALGAALGWALWLIATESRRERLFQRLRAAGRLVPLVYIANVLLIAAMFFAAVTLLLARHGFLRLPVTGGEDVAFGRLLDFYVWHFLDLVPLVKVNETLHWKEPLTYDAGVLGWLVLLFKVAVLVPTFGALAGSFEQRARRRHHDHWLESGGA